MQIVIRPSAEAVGEAAATLVAAAILKKENAVLGLATGSTMLPTYSSLQTLCQQGSISFSKVRTFNLDEYVGLAPDHINSYARFMRENLFDYINIDKSGTRLPNGLAGDVAKECHDYDALIAAAGGIDLQLLGIGHNGHIGFNEPGDAFEEGTHEVRLTESTLEANSRFFDNPDDQPRTAMTMGVGSIFRARSILLLATGKGKAEAVRDMVHGTISPKCQASILRLHPCTTIILDTDAAALL